MLSTIKYLIEFKRIPKEIKRCSKLIFDDKKRLNEIEKLLTQKAYIKAIDFIIEESKDRKIELNILLDLKRCSTLMKAKDLLKKIEIEIRNH
jgi:hypothetical protein